MKVNTKQETAPQRDKSCHWRSLAALGEMPPDARLHSPEASPNAARNCDLELSAEWPAEQVEKLEEPHKVATRQCFGSDNLTRQPHRRAPGQMNSTTNQTQPKSKLVNLSNHHHHQQPASSGKRRNKPLALLLLVAASCVALSRERILNLAPTSERPPIDRWPNCDTEAAARQLQEAHHHQQQLRHELKSPIILFASAEVHSGFENSSQQNKHSVRLAIQQASRKNQEQDEEIMRVKFVQKPPPVVRVHEGHAAVLRCQIDQNFPSRAWLKGVNGPLFRDLDFKNTTPSIKTAHRVKFIGDLTANDYSIEINNVIPADEDEYTCQAMPRLDDEIGDPRLWEVKTRLEVIPTPTLTMPPSTEALNSLTTVQEHHHYSPTSRHQSASLESAAPTDSFGLPSSKSPFNNNRAREVQPSARELDRNNQIGAFVSPAASSAFSNYNGNHHATVRASTAYPSVSGPHSGGLLSAALLWPYLLLLLAALLMVANIYLIVQLIRRHTRCVKEREANEDQDEEPSSMA